jgi:hypothetical protein
MQDAFAMYIESVMLGKCMGCRPRAHCGPEAGAGKRSFVRPRDI